MRLAVGSVLAVAGCLSTPGEAPVAGCVDDDGDGWTTCGRYPDCDDADPATHPGAFERGADVDCDDAVVSTGPVPLDVQLTGVGGDDAIQVQSQTARYDLLGTSGHQLSVLQVGGNQLLFDTDDNLERLSAVHVWMRSFAYASTDDAQTLEVEGRGVARVRVDWSHDLFAAGSSTHFTFVPDGRVIRTDDLRLPSGNTAGSSLTDYVALQAPLFSELRWEEPDGTEHDFAVTPPASSFTSPVGATDGVTGFLCARGVDREVGFTARSQDIEARGGLRASIGRTVENRTQLALQLDLVRGAPAASSYVVHTLLWGGRGLAGQPCVETEVRARAFLQPVTLDVAAGGVRGTEVGVDYDLGSDGFVERGGFFAVDATAATVTFGLTGGAGTVFGASTLFRITGLTGADPVVLRRTDATTTTPLVHGRDYFLDHEGDTIWLYLMVSLMGDQIELVSPQASCPACGT